MNKIFKNILLLSCIATLFASCDDFVFGNVHVDYNENPLESKGVARSGADRYVDSLSKVKVTMGNLSGNVQGRTLARWRYDAR